MGDDGQLLSAYASRGDVSSLSALVERHGRWLTAYLRGALPSVQDAEDVFQETWLRVIRSCGSYRGGSVRSYLLRSARSAVIDRFRRNGHPTVSLDSESDEGGAFVGDLVDGAPTPGERFELSATAAEVRRAVRMLPEGPREVFLMRVEGELPFREIAEILGVPLGSALTWMHVATAKLKKKLGRER